MKIIPCGSQKILAKTLPRRLLCFQVLWMIFTEQQTFRGLSIGLRCVTLDSCFIHYHKSAQELVHIVFQRTVLFNGSFWLSYTLPSQNLSFFSTSHSPFSIVSCIATDCANQTCHSLFLINVYLYRTSEEQHHKEAFQHNLSFQNFLNKYNPELKLPRTSLIYSALIAYPVDLKLILNYDILRYIQLIVNMCFYNHYFSLNNSYSVVS